MECPIVSVQFARGCVGYNCWGLSSGSMLTLDVPFMFKRKIKRFDLGKASLVCLSWNAIFLVGLQIVCFIF